MHFSYSPIICDKVNVQNAFFVSQERRDLSFNDVSFYVYVASVVGELMKKWMKERRNDLMNEYGTLVE